MWLLTVSLHYPLKYRLLKLICRHNDTYPKLVEAYLIQNQLLVASSCYWSAYIVFVQLKVNFAEERVTFFSIGCFQNKVVWYIKAQILQKYFCHFNAWSLVFIVAEYSYFYYHHHYHQTWLKQGRKLLDNIKINN